MASSGEGRANYSRRFFWLALSIVLAIAAYTGAWFYAAARLAEQVETTVATLNEGGSRASCENADARGYPFRIGLFCDSVMYENAGEGLAFRAGAFRSAAQVYDPSHIIGELDGPATVAAPGLSALEVDWSGLRASMRLASPLFERISIEGSNITARPDRNEPDTRAFGTVESGELHARPVGVDLDLAARFSGLALDGSLLEGRELPPLDGLLDASIVNGAELAAANPGLRGRSGTIRNLTLSTGEDARLSIAGPVSIDQAGLVDAELQVSVRDPGEIARILGNLVPDMREEIEMGFSAISAMGETPTLPMTIRKGEISLGFLSLGSIPPID